MIGHITKCVSKVYFDCYLSYKSSPELLGITDNIMWSEIIEEVGRHDTDIWLLLNYTRVVVVDVDISIRYNIQAGKLC
jgi:hypothetical protein